MKMVEISVKIINVSNLDIITEGMGTESFQKSSLEKLLLAIAYLLSYSLKE